VTAAPRPARPLAHALAAALGLALLAAACSGGPGAGHPPEAAAAGGGAAPTGVSILFVGDSLTVGARLLGRLGTTMAAAGWRTEIVAKDGEDVSWGLDQVRRRDRVPEVVVVGLGTNPGISPGTFPTDVRTMVDELIRRGARTIVWWPPGDRADAGRVARAATLRAEAGGPLHVPGWPDVLARHPEWLTGDGIHLTTTGYRSLSRFLRDQVGAAADRR
jgi:lysophospholipase L1-like esterase